VSDIAEPKTGSGKFKYLWIMGLGIYVFFLWYFGWQRLTEVIQSADIRFIILLTLAEAFSLWLRAFKWRAVLGPGTSAIGLFFLSKAGGQWSPARLGELAPLMLKRHRTNRMAAWIVVDRLVEMSATFAMGVAGVLVMQVPRDGLLTVMLIAAGILVVGPIVVLTQRRLFLWIASWTSHTSFVHKVMLVLAEMKTEFLELLTRLPVATLCTVFATMVDVWVSVLLFKAFGFDVSFALLAAVQCAHGIAAAVPFTPNATGVPYLAAATLIQQFGHVPAEVLAVAVGLRMAIVGVVFWTSFMVGSLNLKAEKVEPEPVREESE
jgi:uncharacterized membrane protein YbhN (UPF0104 family)